jgi:hypothetical protein
MSTDEEIRKKRAKVLKFLKKGLDLDEPILDDRKKEKRRQRQCSTLRRVIRFYLDVIPIRPTYEKMVAWCDANDKDPSVYQLMKWLENRMQWDQEKKNKDSNEEGESLNEKRERTKKEIARFD